MLSKDSPKGRAIRTGLQVLIAILGFVQLVLADPTIHNYLVQNNLVAIGTLAAIAAVVSYAWNKLEQLYTYLKEYQG